MDVFTVPTVTFRLLSVPLVIPPDRRRVLHVNVTMNPTAGWIRQLLREAFPFTVAPRYLLLDRDALFSAEVRCTVEHVGVAPVRTSVHRPWQNGVAERWIGTGRRELLDHVLVLNEPHRRRVLGEFLEYYHNDRTPLSLGKDPPAPRAVCAPASPGAMVASLPRVGGLHHRYQWREAA